MMKQKSKTNLRLNIWSIILILVAIVVIILISMFAYSKYMTKIEGEASADIAHFSFIVTEKSSDSLTIDLANTRLPSDTTSVAGTTVAPGTKGALSFDINANVSDVALEYDINIDITEVPQNLIFYSDSEMINAIYHFDNKININGFFRSNMENKTATKVIYWYWPMETGQSEEQISYNDGIDSNFIGRNINLGIQVIGNQVREIQNSQDIQVTFDANGGIIEGYGNSEKMIQTVTYCQEYGELPIPTREGYSFLGWNGKNKFNKLKYFNLEDYEINAGNGYKATKMYLKPNTTYKISVKTYNGFDSKNNGVLIVNNKIDKLYVYSWTSIAHDTQGIASFNDANYSYTTDTEGVLYIGYRGTQEQLDTIWASTDVQIEEETTATEFEPYYVTSSTLVTQNKNHTLTAIWEKID